MKSWATRNPFLVGRARLAGLLLAPTLLAGVAHAQAPKHPTGPERGKALLAQYQCGACHTIPGVPAARGEVAQTLRAWSRRSYIAGRLPNRPNVLAQWIMDPQALVPGTAMPRMGAPLADAQAMAAYLFSLE